MYRVGLYTLGCKVSQYETEAVGEEFERLGFSVCRDSVPCDVYVINTCTVTAESDRKSRQLVRRLIKRNSEAVVAVMGCYSQRAPVEVAKILGVSVVVGTENKMTVAKICLDILKEREAGKAPRQHVSTTDVTRAEFEKMSITRAPRTRAYVKIEDGCEAKCTYCAISGARGRVRSKPKDEVIREVETLYRGGCLEIVLTGIETGSYGRDFSEKYTLADLISELDERGSCERIRLGSLAPELINQDFVMRVKDKKILAPHFHLSLQSGSSRVLAKMKRRYTAEGAMKVIEDIRNNIKGATFTTDLMVGFPGESEEDFLETVDFVRKAELLDAHVFAYSRREGTPAADYDGQIPEAVKRDRSERLIRAKNEVRDKLLSKIVAEKRPLSVVVEAKDEDGYYTAHSDTYVEAKFKSACENLSGSLMTLIPVLHKDGVVYCEAEQK